MNNLSPDFPTKQEIIANNNKIECENNNSHKNDTPQLNKDESNINIINNQKSVFRALSNNSPPPPFQSKENQPRDMGLHVNQYNNNNGYNMNYNYDINNNQYNNQYNSNQYNPNNNGIPQAYPTYNQINYNQPVIVDSSYNYKYVERERKEAVKRAFCSACFFYLIWCFNHILFYLCCLLLGNAGHSRH